ncbi:MAG: hypothetical protein AB7O59_12720 [Pirellulales bacterium]
MRRFFAAVAVVCVGGFAAVAQAGTVMVDEAPALGAELAARGGLMIHGFDFCIQGLGNSSLTSDAGLDFQGLSFTSDRDALKESINNHISSKYRVTLTPFPEASSAARPPAVAPAEASSAISSGTSIQSASLAPAPGGFLSIAIGSAVMALFSAGRFRRDDE